MLVIALAFLITPPLDWRATTPALADQPTDAVAVVARLAASAEALAREASIAEAPVLGALMFYDPLQDLAGGVDGAAYGVGDRAWVEAALGVYDLYRQIGGEAGDKRYLFRRDGARVFVGLEGGAGSWHPTMAQGQAAFLRLLARSSRSLPQGPRQAVMRDGGGIDAVVAVFAEPRRTLLLPADGARSLVIEDAWHAVGTPGLEVRAAPTGAGALSATIDRRPGNAEGPQAVLVFAPGQRFSSREVIEVATPNGAAGGAAAPATPAARPEPRVVGPDRLDPASPAPVADAIVASGATRRYSLSVPSVGAYSIRSIGPSDLVGVLKAPDGTVLARDDDGGAGYNFNLQATLEAGEYTVEVVHCCAGTGPFSIIVAPK